jgi:hypothetical protein
MVHRFLISRKILKASWEAWEQRRIGRMRATYAVLQNYIDMGERTLWL